MGAPLRDEDRWPDREALARTFDAWAEDCLERARLPDFSAPACQESEKRGAAHYRALAKRLRGPPLPDDPPRLCPSLWTGLFLLGAG